MPENVSPGPGIIMKAAVPVMVQPQFSKEAMVGNVLLPQAAFAAAAASNVVRVDVGTTANVAQILRNGRELQAPALNIANVSDFIAHAIPIDRTLLPVGVSQSIPAGTFVAKGTPVDLVLAPIASLNFGLLTQYHADLANKSIAAFLPLVANPAIAPLLDKGSAAALTVDEKATITNALAAQNVGVNDADPARTFDLAYTSLQSARAFQ